MSAQPSPNEVDKKRSGKVGAGAAGAGSGTLLVILANNLPQGNPWKSWLVLVAPTASVAVGAVYIWLKHQVAAYSKDRELKQRIRDSQVTLEKLIQDPLTSEQHREELRKDLEALQKMLVRDGLERIKSLMRAEA